MTLRTRIARLEAAAGARIGNAEWQGPRTDAEWLDYFRQQGAAGVFSHEPDFEQALAEGHLLGLLEMSSRLDEAIPPVGQEEWRELWSWFERNEERLWRLVQPSQLLDLGDGHRMSFGDIRHGLRGTPRDLRSGKLAEDVRKLRAKYGEGGGVATTP